MPSPFNKRDPWGSRRFAQIIASASQAPITLSNIPARGTDLVITVQGRDTTAGTSDSVISLQINGDATSGNYDAGADVVGSGSSANSGVLTASASGCGIVFLPNDGATANASGFMQILIPNYTNTTWFKEVISWGHERVGTSPTKFISILGFTWKSTAAIYSLKFTAGTAFKDGTIVTAYVN